MSAFKQVVKSNENAILAGWLKQMSSSTRRGDLINDADLKHQATEFLNLFVEAAQKSSDVHSEAFASTNEFLKEVAISRMEQGFSTAETAMFILSLKQPVFNAMRDAFKENLSELVSEM